MCNKSESTISQPTVRIAAMVLTILLLLLGSPGRASAQTGAVIFVTSLEDKITSTGGCSLQEAISSANFDNNIAIVGYSSDGTPQFINTQCVPGSGDDLIVLPAGAHFLLDKVVDDAANPFGPTATPLITTRITIEAFGSTLQFVPSAPVCQHFINVPCTPSRLRAFSVGSTGHLTLLDAYLKGFLAHGGYGSPGGGGGGLGAGGAIFVHAGEVVIQNSTFEGNAAVGGDGGGADTVNDDPGGGGGGLGGPGGPGSCAFQGGEGGGGGGSRGFGIGSCAGDGGGTVFDSNNRVPGFDCGGPAGSDAHPNGFDAPCPGGGGGGGWSTLTASGDGGNGNYGGGGGGGAGGGGNGGNGGFGGGGGAGWTGFFGGTNGGAGGFGGGGGAAQDGHVGGGNPGHGGLFGGDANKFFGGGGGGLGGAVFNDSGNVTIRNSTFFNNYVTRGQGGNYGNPGAADNGADAGGAIYSWHGSLDIRNSTITGNQGTGSLAGVAVSGANFSLFNTIISNNGAQECGIGTGSTVIGAGNLIQTNVDCPGVVSTSDPQLGPLQDNTGPTPTMAIASTSPAINTADRNTSLNADQRGIERPQPLDGGFDIGAYERCPLLRFGPILAEQCQNDIIITVPELEPLTMISSPAAGGTLSPSAGVSQWPKNSVVLISATPNPGYTFANWTGEVTLPANPFTTVIMSQSQTITANFTHCACATDVSGSVTITPAGFVLNPVTKRYAQNVTVTNVSAVAIPAPISLVLDSLSGNAALFNATGITDALVPPAGSPFLNADITLAPGQSTTFALQFTDPTNAAITYNTRVLAGPGAR